jgi:hypothetical protein
MISAATSSYVGAVPSRAPAERGPLELASLPKSKRFPPKLLGEPRLCSGPPWALPAPIPSYSACYNASDDLPV